MVLATSELVVVLQLHVSHSVFYTPDLLGLPSTSVLDPCSCCCSLHLLYGEFGLSTSGCLYWHCALHHSYSTRISLHGTTSLSTTATSSDGCLEVTLDHTPHPGSHTADCHEHASPASNARSLARHPTSFPAMFLEHTSPACSSGSSWVLSSLLP